MKQNRKNKENSTVSELRQECKRLAMRNYKNLTKQQLIEQINTINNAFNFEDIFQ